MGSSGSVEQWAKSVGISKQAAYKRVHKHGIPVVDGKIDFAAADRIFEASSNPLQRQRGTSAVGSQRTMPAPNRFGESALAQAQTKREMVRLEKEALELARMKKNLVPVAEANAWAAGMIVRAKDVLLRMAPELKERLAQATDPLECERLIEAEAHRALRQLAEYRPSA